LNLSGGKRFFCSPKCPTGSGAHPTSYSLGTGVFSGGGVVEQPGLEDNHSPPSTAKISYEQSYTCAPPNMPSWCGHTGKTLPFCCKHVKSLWSSGFCNMLVCPW